MIPRPVNAQTVRSTQGPFVEPQATTPIASQSIPFRPHIDVSLQYFSLKVNIILQQGQILHYSWLKP